MEKKIETDLLKIKDFLESRHFDYKIVGSLALQVCGISMGREPEDIDIEVACEQSQEQIFKALAEQYGSNFHNSKEYNISDCEHKPYIFQFGGTKINVWCLRKFTSDNYVQLNGIKYGTVMDVLSKKMAYRRAKDYKDLLSIINNLTNKLEDRFDKGAIVGVESQNGQEIVIYLKVKNNAGNVYTVPAKHCFETIGALRKFMMSSLDKVLNELREIKIE